ncbi:MAG: hypothetical protein MUC82_11965 [Cypionkella sp.]|jgi:hypothetical protein|nr:hypothetical protein [Cypionkella sp.]
MLGRLRAALGRDYASLLEWARGDVRMGVGLNPPGCLPPLNRAIAALERLPASPETAALLARALRAKAEVVQGVAARHLRARAVAKLQSLLDKPRLAVADRAALLQVLAQVWLPMAEDAADPERSLRQIKRAEDAQDQALALVAPTAAAHLARAEIALALCGHPLCHDPQQAAALVLHHAGAARSCGADADQGATADALETAVLDRFPRLRPASDR